MTNMDYRYIEQLLERYWRCETSLEEEAILHSFFSQKDIPDSLMPYKSLFAYEKSTAQEGLGEEFSEKMMKLVNEQEPVKAKVITMRQRLSPLFKAAAVVAIFLTLGNAAQMAFDNPDRLQPVNKTVARKAVKGPSMAMGDSIKADSVLQKTEASTATLIK